MVSIGQARAPVCDSDTPTGVAGNIPRDSGCLSLVQQSLRTAQHGRYTAAGIPALLQWGRLLCMLSFNAPHSNVIGQVAGLGLLLGFNCCSSAQLVSTCTRGEGFQRQHFAMCREWSGSLSPQTHAKTPLTVKSPDTQTDIHVQIWQDRLHSVE